MIRPSLLALMLTMSLGLTTVPLLVQAADPALSSVVDATPTPAPVSEEIAALTQREAATPDLQKFSGGDQDVLYISGGAVALVLLIVLVVILIG
jgi:hypothetical protein